MAIDTRIPLASQAPDAGAAFSSMLTNIGRIDAIRENRKNEPLRDQMSQLALQGQQLSNRDMINQQRAKGLVELAYKVKPMLESNQVGVAMNMSGSLAQQFAQAGIPTDDIQQFQQLLSSGQIGAARALVDQVLSSSQGGAIPAGVREFNTMTEGLTDEQREEARLIELGLKPRAGISAQERVLTNDELYQKSIDYEASKAEASETGKSAALIKWKPRIEREVTKARKLAEEQGTVFNELNQAQAAMPQLLDVMDRLKELAPIATSTYIGRAFDFAVKETGFGAPKGAPAREKYISIINNQVLPLLKPTFGAAFTVQEGESLKATMGDPDVAPETKIEVLNSFIEQKYRDIETKQTQFQSLSDEMDLTQVPDEDLFK